MYGDLSAQGLEIMGFPCNQFGAQEPWSEDKVLEFVQSKFNVSFPMFSKIEVNGPNTHEFYRYLKNNEVYKSQNLQGGESGKHSMELRQVPGQQGGKGDWVLRAKGTP